jgi:hypothetical protein
VNEHFIENIMDIFSLGEGVKHVTECGLCEMSFSGKKEFSLHVVQEHKKELCGVLMCENRGRPMRDRKKQWQDFLRSWELDERDEGDEAYRQVIASSIVSDGLKVNLDQVNVVRLEAVEAGMVQVKEEGCCVCEKFWKDLDALHMFLTTTRKLDDNNGKYICKVCNSSGKTKDYKSIVRLLEHCWTVHKDTIAQFS